MENKEIRRLLWKMDEFAESLHCNRRTANKIAAEAGAIVRVGRLVFVNPEIAADYLKSISG